MAVYQGAKSRATRYLGSQTSPLPYLGAGVLFSGITSPPTYVASTPFVSGTGAVTPTFASTGRVANDFLTITVESANQTIATPSGWTQLPSSPQSTGTAATVGGVRVAVFGKISDGTETTVSIADSGDHTTAIGSVFRGVDTTTVTNLLQNSNDLTNATYWHPFGGGAIAASNTLTTTGVTVQADGGIYTDSLATQTAGGTFSLIFEAQSVSGTQVFAANIYSDSNGDNISSDFTVTSTTTWTRFKHKATLSAGLTYNNLGFCPGSALANVNIRLRNVMFIKGDVDINTTYIPTTTAAVTSFLGINVSAGSSQAATTAFSFPGVTPTVDNCMIVHFIGNDRDSASTTNLSSITNANLTSLTKQFDQTVTSGFGGGIAIITGIKATAGATGNTTATNAATNTNASVTIAFAPTTTVESKSWTPDNLSVKPLVIMDASKLTWSGSNFSSGTNTGQLGGSFITALGTPTKAAADINGYDSISFAATSAIGIASTTKPAGNVFVFCVLKKTGDPANGVGAMMSQADSTPGWSSYAHINSVITLSNGHVTAVGDSGALGWPAGTTNLDKDIIVHPPTDDGTYHIVAAKVGSSHIWRYDGTTLTPTYYSDLAIPAVTGNLYIGTSYGAQNINANMAYIALLQDPSDREIAQLEGWAAWKYGLTSKLPATHPYKAYAPLLVDTGWETTQLNAASMVFSNSNRTVVGNITAGTDVSWCCYSVQSRSTGKHFASISLDAREYGDVSVTDNTDSNYVHYAYNGTIWSSVGSVLDTDASYTAPCIIDLAFDADNHLVWFRLNGGNWNNSGTANPATGTGGYALPATTNSYHVKVSMPYYTDSKRTLVAQKDYTYSVPSGFSPLD